MQLPWEQDVNQKYKVLLAETLNSFRWQIIRLCIYCNYSR
jgi:hypothetical protein